MTLFFFFSLYFHSYIGRCDCSNNRIFKSWKIDWLERRRRRQPIRAFHIHVFHIFRYWLILILLKIIISISNRMTIAAVSVYATVYHNKTPTGWGHIQWKEQIDRNNWLLPSPPFSCLSLFLLFTNNLWTSLCGKKVKYALMLCCSRLAGWSVTIIHRSMCSSEHSM